MLSLYTRGVMDISINQSFSNLLRNVFGQLVCLLKHVIAVQCRIHSIATHAVDFSNQNISSIETPMVHTYTSNPSAALYPSVLAVHYKSAEDKQMQTSPHTAIRIDYSSHLAQE